MSKLQFSENKTLKLTNVLKYKILLNEEDFDLNVAIEQMQSYIKTKGAMQIGPLIQFTRTFLNEAGELDMEIIMMLQCNNYIHNVEQPYSMESVIRVPNALYCHYTGPETFLKFAYDKINLEAFENDIPLADYNYTIFIDNNQEEDIMIADVFVPRAEKE
jgi:hypothetical protein